MNKDQFLQQLKLHLNPLPNEDIDEILEDYELHIQEELSSGKFEKEIIQNLGSPNSIANQHKKELLDFSQTTATEKIKSDNKNNNLIIFILMQLINLFILLPLVTSLLGTLVGLLFISITPLSGIAIALVSSLSILLKISLILIFIGLSILLINLSLSLFYLGFKILKRYVYWNINLLKQGV